LRRFRWSWKVPTRFQIHKYTTTNMIRYLNYLQWIQSVPQERLKYTDESHIVSKDLHKKAVLGMKSTRVYVPNRSLSEAHASLTILVSSHGTPITFDYREESNTQWNFTNFILHCCRTEALEEGDYLILNNAGVHNGWDTIDLLEEILNVAGVNLVYLPAYSPELNPCELVFNVVKSRIRMHQQFGSCILEEVLNVLALVSMDNMSEFYKRCIFPPVVLPELQ